MLRCTSLMNTFRGFVAAVLVLAVLAGHASADVSNGVDSASIEVLTLEGAMQMAAENNAAVSVNRASVEKSRELGEVADSALRPQVHVNARFLQIDRDRAEQGAAERDTRVGVGLTQSIYDESLRVRRKIAPLATRQAMHVEQSSQLDAMADAGTGYLRLALAQATHAVEMHNLELTLGHLKFARDRFGLGAASQDEVLRWEAQEARQRGGVLDAVAAIQKLRLALNRTMCANADEEWLIRPPALVDGKMYFLDEHGLLAWMNTPERVAQFREFSTLKALETSPELHQLDDAIAAQRLVITQKRRGSRVPVVSFNAGYDRILDRHFTGNDTTDQLEAAGFPVSRNDSSDNEWQFNITATLPLWEGGGRKHDVAAEEAELDRLELTRVAIAQQIEQRALASVYALQSSQPKIGLARIAADRSERSLKIISDKYQRGATQIVDVLDAQNEALRAGIGAAVAQASYLADLVEFQRAIGWFEKFQSPEARDAWVNHFKRYIGQQQDQPADADHKH